MFLKILRVFHSALGGGLQSDVDLFDAELLKFPEIQELHLVYHANPGHRNEFEDPRRFHYKLPISKTQSKLKRNLHPAYLKSTWKLLSKIIEEKKIDLIHNHSPTSVIGNIAAILARRYKIPLVQTFHGSRDPRIGVYTRHILSSRIPAWSGERYLAITEAAAQMWKKKSVDVEIVGVPVDHRQFLDSEPLDKFNWKKNPAEIILFYPARFTWVKNQIFLTDVAHLIRQSKPHLQFRMILTGPVIQERYFEKLKRRIQQLQLANIIEIVPQLSYKEMIRAYKSSDILIFPTLEEALGKITIEAGLCGIPTIGSRTGGVPEVISHNETGLIVDSGDIQGFAKAIIDLSENPARRMSLGQRAREEYSKKYLPESYAKRHLEIYRSCFS